MLLKFTELRGGPSSHSVTWIGRVDVDQQMLDEVGLLGDEDDIIIVGLYAG
jgi:hypothetical protein